MALKILARKDELGNNASHFFKSGNVLRNPENTALKMRGVLPDKGLYKTNLEYDLWYDLGGREKIHGYVYTDMLSDYLYLKPANEFFADKAMVDSLDHEPTEEGERLVSCLSEGVLDKYRLRPRTFSYDFVIFLPGTNIIGKAMDGGKVKRAVDQGAVLKPHPISSVSLIQSLKKSFGDQNVLGKKESGHQLLRESKIVGCCANSEMGLAAIAADKGFHLFTTDFNQHFTYSSIYKAVLRGGNYKDNLIRLFSSPFSGIVGDKSPDKIDRIAAFFNQFSEVPHVEPKNSNT